MKKLKKSSRSKLNKVARPCRGCGKNTKMRGGFCRTCVSHIKSWNK